MRVCCNAKIAADRWTMEHNGIWMRRIGCCYMQCMLSGRDVRPRKISLGCSDARSGRTMESGASGARVFPCFRGTRAFRGTGIRPPGRHPLPLVRRHAFSAEHPGIRHLSSCCCPCDHFPPATAPATTTRRPSSPFRLSTRSRTSLPAVRPAPACW